jgi:gliding motility-associated-like protein
MNTYLKHFLLWGLLLLIALPTQASHIVGGEIQVRHIREFNYDFILNLYFDEKNPEAGAKEDAIRISIFRIGASGTENPVESITLPLVYEQKVSYSNPECDKGEVKTLYLRYLRNVSLDPLRYTHQQGYYVIWERCCRNYNITNIKPTEIRNTGMTFYTEIPRISTGQLRTPFVNSSPIFNIPKGEFLCINRPFSMDFSAIDLDGDELRYTLVTPYKGHSSSSDPIPEPKSGNPYSSIDWGKYFLNGVEYDYTANTAIPHNPNFPSHQFNVESTTGILRVTPALAGLFVFSVKCEEYRSGVKIGEVRRDFQFTVLSCEINNKPTITLQTGTSGGAPVYYQEGQILNLTPDNLCFTLRGTDIDNPEPLGFRVRGVNFTVRSNMLSPSSGTVRGTLDTLKSQFCWDKCLFSTKDAQGNYIPYIMDLIVSDDGCPANLSDTVRVSLIYPPVANTAPTMGSDAPVDVSGQYDYMMTREVGQLFEFNVFGNDVDNDMLALSMQGVGFSPADLGMQFEPKSGKGSVTSKFTWSNGCAGVTQQDNEFILEFFIREESTCNNSNKKIRVKLLLIDRDVDLTSFLPANAFSPNGDTYNATFEMPNLPQENCRFRFERITVFNRWGVKVFESTDRNFKWDGGEFPAATYFYTVDFKGTQYKGTVSLIR